MPREEEGQRRGIDRPREEEGPLASVIGAGAPEERCGDTREEEKCRRFCHDPQGGGGGPCNKLICRTPLPGRSG